MIKVRLSDLKMLTNNLTKDPVHAFLTGVIMAKYSPYDKLFLQSISQNFKTIDKLLQNRLIGQLQKAHLVELSLNLSPDKINNFRLQIQALTSNQELQDFDEALRSVYKKIQNNQPIKREMNLSNCQNLQATLIVNQQLMERERTQNLQQTKNIGQAKIHNFNQQLKRQSNVQAQCSICLCQLQNEFELLQCGHIFHKKCLQSSFNQQIDTKKLPLICPQQSCRRRVQQFIIKQILSNRYLQKHQKFSIAQYIDRNNKQYSWCPTVGCQYCFFYLPGQIRFRCQNCKKSYCLKCRSDWHKGLTCQQFQATRDPQKGQIRFKQFVRGMKFKQCPECKFWVQKVQGCDSITCRCGAYFCYECGENQKTDHGQCRCNRRLLEGEEQNEEESQWEEYNQQNYK